MKHIPISGMAISKMRKAAKILVRTHPTLQLADALDQVAKDAGYKHWKHVLDCAHTVTATAAQGLLELSELGFFPEMLPTLRAATCRSGGLFMISGTRQSGRTTTLRALLAPDEIAEHNPKVYALENPHPTADHTIEVFRNLMRTGCDGVLFDGNATAELPLIDQLVCSGHKALVIRQADCALAALQGLAQDGFNVERLRAPRNISFLLHQQLFPRNCPHCSLKPDIAARQMGLDGKNLSAWERWWAKLEKAHGIERSRYRLRNTQGCSHCAGQGFDGATLAYEYIEPNREFLDAIRKGVPLGRLRSIWRGWSNGIFDSSAMAGKTVLECAMYKASLGIIDPQLVTDAVLRRPLND